MLKLLHDQIDAIRNSELRVKFADYSQDPKHLILPLSELDQGSIDSLWNVCIDALTSEAPVVEWFTAEQDLGPYFVSVRGVPGAYFVEAAERDNLGVFSNLEEARSTLFAEYGEFIVEQAKLP